MIQDLKNRTFKNLSDFEMCGKLRRNLLKRPLFYSIVVLRSAKFINKTHKRQCLNPLKKIFVLLGHIWQITLNTCLA